MELRTFAIRAIVAILASALPSAAMAQATPAKDHGPIVVVGEKPPPADKVKCKTVNTGTLIPKRVCMTPSEWAHAERRSQDALQSMRDWQRMRCRYGAIC